MNTTDARIIGSTCLCLHVRRAARRMARLYDEALRPIGLSNGQFSLLTMLAARDDWNMQDLADSLGTDRSSLTAALKPLQRRALVESRADTSDRRVRHLALTREGRSLLDDAMPLWRHVQGQAETSLAARSIDTFRGELQALG